jgi:hypothetical protein
MNHLVHRSRPSWRVPDGRFVRPELWLLAIGVVGMLLVEVSESARMAEISMNLDQTRSALQQAHARLDYVRAELERRSTRAELAPLGSQLGLAPSDAQQVVVLPAEYLAGGERRRAGSATRLSWAERASRMFVPEARARGRTED